MSVAEDPSTVGCRSTFGTVRWRCIAYQGMTPAAFDAEVREEARRVVTGHGPVADRSRFAPVLGPPAAVVRDAVAPEPSPVAWLVAAWRVEDRARARERR